MLFYTRVILVYIRELGFSSLHIIISCQQIINFVNIDQIHILWGRVSIIYPCIKIMPNCLERSISHSHI